MAYFSTRGFSFQNSLKNSIFNQNSKISRCLPHLFSQKFATSGNRTRASRVAGENSTTEPTLLDTQHWRLQVKVGGYAISPDVSFSRFCLYQQNGRSKILKQTLWFASWISKLCQTMHHKSFLKSAFKVPVMPSGLKGWKCISFSIIRWRKIRVKNHFLWSSKSGYFLCIIPNVSKCV